MPAQLRSFRDPDGTLALTDGRVLRHVYNDAVANLRALLSLAPIQAAVESGKLVSTEWLTVNSDGTEAILEHGRIPRSYPYEWPAEMLHRAGELTLELCETLLPLGYGLKDATPYNVLYKGAEPVFVDVLSFERRNPRDTVWLPYAQFVRTFLLPLLALKTAGLEPHELLYSRRDGLLPQDVWPWLSPVQRLRRPALQLVTIPKLLSRVQHRKHAIYEPKYTDDAEQGQYLLRCVFKQLRSQLNALTPAERESSWSRYMGEGSSYTQGQFEVKQRVMERFIDEARPQSALDLGCNTGHFSILAAQRAGARVVGIDSDAASVGQLWRSATRLKLPVLPLVVDISRPTPALGWLNAECPSFLERAKGKFDMVFGLALIHHLLVAERVPLPSILSLIADLTTDWAAIEFVGREDPMFQALARGRGHLYDGFSQENFEGACAPLFTIVRSEQIPECARVLYLLRKRQ